MTTSEIYRTCAERAHMANKAYCESIGDRSQPSWDEAPNWQRQSAIVGAQHAIENPNAGPSDSHDSWLAEKELAGWVYGPEKDPERKQHPCMVPYNQLPEWQRTKDHIFLAVVRGAYQELCK